MFLPVTLLMRQVDPCWVWWDQEFGIVLASVGGGIDLGEPEFIVRTADSAHMPEEQTRLEPAIDHGHLLEHERDGKVGPAQCPFISC